MGNVQWRSRDKKTKPLPGSCHSDACCTELPMNFQFG
jgi:hypothetical protein